MSRDSGVAGRRATGHFARHVCCQRHWRLVGTDVNFFLLTVAALLAAIMGFAIQRGATCTVAAVDEIVRASRAHRLIAMIEASLWVAGGFIIADALHLMPTVPPGHAVSHLTILGGVLLGVGALINQACVFGAIARLGSGEWAYLLTPAGFYLGCVSVDSLFSPPKQMPLVHASPVFSEASVLAVPLAIFMLWRVGRLLWQFKQQPAGAAASSGRFWSPHTATAIIGVTFFFLLISMGAWAYTDVLAEIARGMTSNLPARILLVLALLAGAVIGGWTAGRFSSRPVTTAQLAKCLIGGVLMGWGSLLIPGSNDGLILLGMPLLWPYAWVAFMTMCVSIGAIMLVQKKLSAQ